MIDTILEFFKNHVFNIIIILVLTVVAHSVIMTLTRKLVRRALRPEKFASPSEEKQREETLLSTLNTAIRATIWVIAGLLLLAEIGLDIGPLLAGAGIAGVALGFGAQSMVKDFLSGFFILVENQYRVGDVVEINQTVSGVVEMMTLRATVLRDLDGMVHHIPNGEITIATNMTMEFANVNLDVGVGYSTDIEKLEKLINTIGRSMHQDEKWKDSILEQPTFLRIDEFADSAIIVKIVGKTVSMQQWAVTGELRKRLKIAFDKEGIEIPFPQRVVTYVNEAPKIPATKKK